jgi:two-component system, cell cycle sensor histidine kinase and response regulator CckA
MSTMSHFSIRSRIARLFGAGESPATARASFCLLATGGALGLASTAFPSERPRDTAAVVVVSALGLLLSLVPGVGFRRLQPFAFELLCAAGTLLVSAGLYFGGTSAYEFFYFWVAFYAAYFFSARRLALQIAFILVCYPVSERLGQGFAPTSMRWLLASATLVVAAGMISVLHRNAERTLERLEALIEAAPLAIFELDDDARVLRWNSTAEETFGWKRDEVVGGRLPILAEREQQRPLADYIVSAPPRSGYELACSRRDHSSFEASVFTAPLGTGEGSGRLVLVADTSERRDLERRVAHGSKMEAVGRLAGGIAHDFNNLLLIIRSHAWLLRDRLGDSSELVEIENAADDAGRIVRQLLTFGRAQALEPQSVDLNDLLSGVESLLAPVIGEDIELVRSVGDRGATVLADPTQLELVVVNLVLNARDALPAGGRLEIATEPALRNGARWARLRVSDDGAGIDPATQERMFDPFFTTKEEGRGTGLGLAVVHELVAQNGGEIEVWSARGRGTTVSVYLPYLDAPPTSSRPAYEGELLIDDQAGMETVLVADDEADVRESLRRSLERYGYRVFTAGDGEAALAIAAELKDEIDVVVTDVVMATMSGFELGRRLGSIAPDLPVVYISGYPDEAILDAPLPAPAFLPKPFTPPLLAKTIRETIGSVRLSCA